MSEKFFKCLMRVAWVDTDGVGVVHFSNYFRFFERAEEEFYRFLGFGFGDFGVRGLWFPRVESFCRYRKPARFDDLLEVEVYVLELREKSVRLGFKITNKDSGELLAEGYLVVVAAGRELGRAVPIPLDVVERLRPFARQVL